MDGPHELELPDALGDYFQIGLKLGHHADLELAIPGNDSSDVVDEPVVGVNLVLRDTSFLEVQVD